MTEAELYDDESDANPFAGFGLIPHDTITSLCAKREALAARIGEVASFFVAARSDVLGFFDVKASLTNSTDALKTLDSQMWREAMDLTDLREAMPEARRQQWDYDIHERRCPPFTEQTVRDTFAGLLSQRSLFLAEKVHGIFEGLSGEHVKLAQIEQHHRCLEPQAGLGALAMLMPKHTVCVEISAQRVRVLELRGLQAICKDFLAYSDELLLTPQRFDRIVLNPPFDQGRWRAHLDAAVRLLAPGGRLVAILPVGAKSKDELVPPGYSASFEATYENAFTGVGQDVTLLLVQAPGGAQAAPSASAAIPATTSLTQSNAGQMSLL